jgi:hypothetical protein
MSFGLSAGAIGLIGAGASVAGGLMGASAAGDAADAQLQGGREANATQRYMYDTTRADNAPFRESGVAANNRLSYLLGLSPNSGTSSTPGGLSGQRLVETRDGVPVYNTDLYNNNPAYRNAWDRQQAWNVDHWGTNFTQATKASDVEQNLRDMLGNELAQSQQVSQNNAQNDPAYGSLLRNFTMADRDADPVYQSGLQFGLDEGTKGINRMAAASGSSLSGATLKALTRFGNDYGSTKANESFNRFNTNQNSVYNKLAGMSGSGQQATNQVSAAGANMANNVSQNQIGMGNARGASSIAGANALSGGLSGAYKGYQQNQLIDMLGNRNKQATPLRLDPYEYDGNY